MDKYQKLDDLADQPYEKPILLVDLDDTLFQTKRKMQQEHGWQPEFIAALDRSLTPRSFMTDWQRHMCAWLLQTSELIPVTARGTGEIARVQIPFASWKITTHGAVILDSENQPLPSWEQHIKQQYQRMKVDVPALHQLCETLIKEHQIQAWARINYEYGELPIYFVMKHEDSLRVDEIYKIADILIAQIGDQDYYVHRNGNNVAFIPNFLDKGRAVKHLLDLIGKSGTRPVIGFGDSLSDYRFLQYCHWSAMPGTSQLSDVLRQSEEIIAGKH